MSQSQSVADRGQGVTVPREGDLPGTVLEPNADVGEQMTTIQNQDPMQQFGTEQDRPTPDAGQGSNDGGVEVDANGVPTDPTQRGRYEHHQKRADELQAKLDEVEKVLAEKSKMDPVVELIKRDKESLEFLERRLKGETQQASTPPVEEPQKPRSYNEVEAYSNEESESWKYRIAKEEWRDSQLSQLQNANTEYRQREQEAVMKQRQELAQREQMAKLREEVVSKGVPDTEFEQFVQLMKTASTDDMVDFYNHWSARQTGQPNPPRTQPQYERPTSGVATPRRPVNDGTDPNKPVSGPIDIGAIVKQASSRNF